MVCQCVSPSTACQPSAHILTPPSTAPCHPLNAQVMLGSGKLKTITSERTLLKNLGAWLGKLTLANNRPVLQVRQAGRVVLLCVASMHPSWPSTLCPSALPAVKPPCPRPLTPCCRPPCPSRPLPAEAPGREGHHPGGVRAGQDAGGAVLCAHAAGARHGLQGAAAAGERLGSLPRWMCWRESWQDGLEALAFKRGLRADAKSHVGYMFTIT